MKQPFFILGSGRSGSTFLYHLLSAHPQVALTNEANLADALVEPEKRILLSALEAHDWNRQDTAAELGINRTTLYKKMKRLGLKESRHVTT